MTDLKGYRKLIACLYGVLAAGALCAVGKLTGGEFVSCLTVCVGGFLAANTIKKA